MNIQNLLKVLLHIHLDGSVRINTASNILNKDVTNSMMSIKYKDLNDYLTKFDIPISIMQTKENLERISEELALDLKKDNVIYAEVRFAPIFHIKNKLSLEEVVDSVLKGLSKVNIKTNLILCMMRGLSYEDNKQIIYLAKKYLNNGVVGIDLAGAEGLYKTEDYEELFKLAYRLHIPFTIHAGEADGINSIKSALNFGTKRIGHGVRCTENNIIINELIKNDITLEICPKSNIDTQIYKDYKDHPIKKLYDKGVKITINTDNNTVSNINLNKEYENLINTFHFTKEDLLKMNINAIEASFTTNKEKQELINYLTQSYRKESL